MDKAKADNKPFFIWHNTTRMHVFTYISPKYQAMMNATDNYGRGRSRHGADGRQRRRVMQQIEDIGEDDNTIVMFTTDNGAEVFTWPDGGRRRSRAPRELLMRVDSAYRDHPLARSRQAGIGCRTGSSPVWTGSRRSLHAAGNPDITNQLLKGVKLGDRTYKNHLDGYNQTALLEGTGPSARHELFYFGGSTARRCSH